MEELASGCKSFDYHSATNHCKLYSVDIHDPDVKLIDSEAMDHYESTSPLTHEFRVEIRGPNNNNIIISHVTIVQLCNSHRASHVTIG